MIINESIPRGISTNRTVLESLNEGDFFVYVVWKCNWDLYLEGISTNRTVLESLNGGDFLYTLCRNVIEICI